MSADLQNSMIQEPSASNIVAEHAKAMQAILDCQLLIKQAFETYTFRKKNAATTNDLLWIVYPVLQNCQKILDSIMEE